MGRLTEALDTTIGRGARRSPGLACAMEGGEKVEQGLLRLWKVDLKNLRPELKTAMEPMAAAARAGIHNVTGTLGKAIRVRIGRGDRPGRYSAYIAATATRRAAAKRFGGKRAKEVTAAGKPTDRYRLWYATPLEKGHAGPGGTQVAAHPFAEPAFEATAEQVATAAGEKLLDRVIREW
jgi:HK97 gp10 family phage protein